MKTLLHHSFEFRRYHMAILTVVVAVIVWILLNYFKAIQAEVEEYTFHQSISTIQRFFDMRFMLSEIPDKNCYFLKTPDLFAARIGVIPVLEASHIFQSNRIHRWEYIANQRRLIYHVNSSDYFTSPKGNTIIIDLLCKDGSVQLKISPYKWCNTANWFSRCK